MNEIELVNKSKFPIQNENIQKNLAEKELDLTAMLWMQHSFAAMRILLLLWLSSTIIHRRNFDTSIKVIKSTISVGFIKSKLLTVFALSPQIST